VNKIIVGLVITKPGHFRNGLQSLLRTIPRIEIIAESKDPSVLLKMREEIHPEREGADAHKLTPQSPLRGMTHSSRTDMLGV
jgi:hypothetical protein